MSYQILEGDVLSQLATLTDESVNCCVTSPPYWGLRDYGVEGQIGLEKTPEEYVARLVEIFREVRRVLRGDGTLWLNLGDSYFGGGQDGRQLGSKKEKVPWASKANRETVKRGLPDPRHGLKFKDLIGIPWRVAFALQQPYYSGRIKRVEDRIWLAAMIDAEGCMFIHKRKAGQSNGQGYQRLNDNYAPGLEVANTSEAIVNRCMEIVGAGSICSQSPEQNDRRKQTIYRWNLRTTECRDIVREVYPHLVGKQQQARILCGCPSSGESAEAAHAALMGLHNGAATSVDFPAPETMFELGWYLRSDIIWSKKNPRPESVTDRPTKAHEYVFLLAKSEQYYYDADAIKEEAISNPGRGVTGRGKQGSALAVGCNGRQPQQDHSGWMGGDGKTRNRRSVWTIATHPYKGAHFATFPPKLIEPMILAGCPVGGTVLDPFVGSGTTCMVAESLERNSIGIELNPAYITLAHARLHLADPTSHFPGERSDAWMAARGAEDEIIEDAIRVVDGPLPKQQS